MLSTHQRRALICAVTLALLGAGLPSVAAAADEGPDLSRFHDQRIRWTACPGDDLPEGLQCGKVTVPLDYARPADGTLELAMARFTATGRSRGSVLLNFGGPGGPGVSELAGGGADFMGLTNGYDVVAFDPRGVGRSSPVSCGDGMDSTAPDADPDSDADPGTGADGGTEAEAAPEESEDPRAALDVLRKVAAECAEHSGPVMEHIGTVDAARDLDVMRAALGDRKLNYLGFSYGTRLGAVYAAQFPGRTGRMVLDGVDTLTEPLAEQGVTGAQGQQTALEDFLDWCTQDINCAFGQDPRSAREEVLRLIGSLDADPVPADFGIPFSGQDLVGAIGQALYSKELWPALSQALTSLVQDGDTRGIMRFFVGGGTFPGGGAATGNGDGDGHGNGNGTLVDEGEIPFDNLPAALMAINCADDPDRPSADRIVQDLGRLRAAYERASPVFGRYRLAQALMCYGRPRGTSYIREEVRDVGTPKMLLVGTRGDPATPYRWTTETADRLGSSAVVLDNKGEGHTGYSSSKCVHRKIDDFLLYGRLPADGSSCGAEE
ncbi:pimeloyl-ACP methyl ester carboxylesterase [Streptomyces sp. V3I8]|uniref:alpha/beta hydrolase n=1 Tax=Streptomyces sp. V3I8 TaxID=3042279 RepID=UPI00278B0B91|nr:alpha/beta hydrolase [Streptomyces sp. V3I8]MDQ1040769.1 pimeloyl-ACP methyl ester carboxylesterase [Streptomyces sp. V3I8]